MGRDKKVNTRKKEAVLTVPINVSVAQDLITVLRKFSEHKMGLMTVGQTDQASRLLGLNLFRCDVEEALRKVTK